MEICLNCGEYISTITTHCYYCGYKNKKGDGILLYSVRPPPPPPNPNYNWESLFTIPKKKEIVTIH